MTQQRNASGKADDVSGLIQVLTDKLKYLRNQNSALRRQLADRMTDSRSSGQVEKLNTEMEALRTKKAALSVACKNLSERANASEAQLKNLQRRISTNESKLEKLKEDIRNARKKLAATQFIVNREIVPQEIVELERKIDAKEQNLQEIRAKNEALLKPLIAAENVRMKLDSMLSEAEWQARALSAEHELKTLHDKVLKQLKKAAQIAEGRPLTSICPSCGGTGLRGEFQCGTCLGQRVVSID